MHIILILTLIIISHSLQIHHEWDQDMKVLSKISDVLWNYCDVKCTYLERYFPKKDFVVVIFKHKKYQTKRAGCFIKNAFGDLVQWDKEVQNKFYAENCSVDFDQFKDMDNYEEVERKGVGIGTQISA